MNSIDDINIETSSFDLLFKQPARIQYADINFDFKIDTDHFIEWLKIEGEDVTGDYKYNVGSMCEYSCLYIGMLLNGVKLNGDMKIYYGKFGFWEHYWIGYVYEGMEYFIDLTLMQFIDDSPELAISKLSNEPNGYSFLSDGEPIEDYIKRQRAFDFYTNPKTLIKPLLETPSFLKENPFDSIKYDL